MLNPSYLIKSRHDIYYFRYPLPVSQCGAEKRVSISLRTRCPREALRLAKALEYHSFILIAGMDLIHMKHAEIMSLFKEYYAEVLDRMMAHIDNDGSLPKKNIQNIEKYLEELDFLIENEADDMMEHMGVEYEDPDFDPLHGDLKKIMDKNELNFEKDSREYTMMKAAYKFSRRRYFTDLLTYNRQATDFNLLGASHNGVQENTNHHKPALKLGTIIEKYIDDIKDDLQTKSLREQRDCLNYLIDWLGEEYPITKVDNDQAREIRESLKLIPQRRNIKPLTKGLTVSEQIAVAEKHGMEKLSNKSINKYLIYFDALFKWVQRDRYREDNPFSGIRVKDKKNGNGRDKFDEAEVRQIVEGLGDGSPNGVLKNSTQYWGALIAVYTGARRNEIAALTPNDIKQDKVSGIWYFDITDEREEGKDIKTDAARRVVPIHSRLLDLSFLKFVEEARSKRGKKNKHGFETRLLYKLTYTPNEKWGRNLGRWFNEKYLVALGLKTEKKVLHSLRHSFITYQSAKGVEGSIVKSIVGHEPDTVTTQNYTHYGVEHLPVFKEAIEKLPY
jgi:site-specific recombinase XerD